MPTRPRRYTRLTTDQVLAWADHHHAATGSWPSALSGPVLADTNERWFDIDACLRLGLRGLPGGCSLARLLSQVRGVRWRNLPPPLTTDDILAWADRHRERTGAWPTQSSGPVADQPGEKWANLNAALRNGTRGLPGGSSLAQLLAARRGRRNPARLPPLTIDEVLRWADRHRERTGRYPTAQSGAVAEAEGETWHATDQALYHGLRGLPGGSSLARLLHERRGRRHHLARPRLTEAAIVAWARAFQRRKGRYPTRSDGPVARAPGESWGAIDVALHAGVRGLPGGSSLAQLLARECGYVHQGNRRGLSTWQILRWADDHRERTGRWPTCRAGAVAGAAGETWPALDAALRAGRRGLPGGSSLACLLAEARGRGHPQHPARLSVSQVLAWADEHRRRTGRWPSAESGRVAPGSSETWSVVNACLQVGRRGLPGATTLRRFLAEHGRGGA
jgi:hypothetical protein